MVKLTYKQMYAKAAKVINENGGSYKGYSGANAISLYVSDKFGVNAAHEAAAHNALCDAMALLQLSDS